ncbi:nitrate reductase [Actibacterium pelagium]|uniref:Nitrate reductase n=1 Tax=Actibacterium pelagium TaxID=2029103 RepID=A0A917AG56_9RHOB|nr:nitrate reductase [Actibacterium pelagium]GGE51102.1 nitrate reductase [Actibacterium pelagium]
MDGGADPIVTPKPANLDGVTTRTTCAYCGVGCGVLATTDSAGRVTVKGDPDHPANLGRLCSKGSALGETISLEGRLLQPQVDGVATDWDRAVATVAERFKATIAEHGPDSVAFYVSGQLLTEDYYVANKLMKGFIGSANIDTNSRLCMASSVAGHKRAFGADTVPGQYSDLEEADLVVLVGSNLAWCHPVLYQRLAAAKAARPGMKVVNVDPRRTATSDLADMHLALRPGSDVALFNGLLVQIAEQDAVNTDYVNSFVNGFDAALVEARMADISVTGLQLEELQAFYDLWVGTEKVVTIYSQGVNQSSAGADKVNAILNCHLATGRIGKPGMGPLSVTGQPNAMGGREVGGLANMLACHLDIENPAHRTAVHEFWDSPVIADKPGLKAVDMFNAVGEGKIKALWVMCTNPVVSMPEADKVKAAIKGCDFVVVSDMFADTDTAKLADIVLPATGWAEKDGTVTNSERCISRQKGFLPAPGEARHDWQIMCNVAKAMGWASAFDFHSPAEVFREYAAMSGISGRFGRDFDISGLADVSEAEYQSLKPTHWPITKTRTGGRYFADGSFFTGTGKANMLAVSYRPPQSIPTEDAPYIFNTGRVRDHWHTMTRTARSARLSQHLAEPYLEVHPEDALKLGLKPADLAEVSNAHGRSILRVLVTDRVAPGQVFAPMHWTGQTSSSGRIDTLVTANVDPVSGQPESKAATVAIAPYKAGWYGFAVCGDALTPKAEYWALAKTKSGYRAELAGRKAPADWEAYARQIFDLPNAQVVTYIDEARGLARLAFLEEGVLRAALFAAREPVALARSYVADLLGQGASPAVLSGRPGEDQPDPGATVCACFDVGINTILTAIETKGLTSVDAIGEALNAGTNCGSCKPELATLLVNALTPKAAAE